jgi:hypothetical protein
MAQNKQHTFGPVALTTTLTTNILNPAVTSMAGPVGMTIPQPYVILKRIQIANKTGTAATFSLWRGATGGNVAGTELFVGVSVPANTTNSYNVNIRLDAADFLVGGAGTTTALTFEADGEIGISG